MEKGNWIKKHPIWTGIIGFCGLVILLSFTTPNNDCNCPDCICEECNCPSTEYLELKFLVTCESYNEQVNLVNELMDWVDDYANPTGIVLTRQINVDCYELLNN